jgi:hypothetical protein
MIGPSEVTGATGAFGRVMAAINLRSAETPAGPRYVFLGKEEYEELKALSSTWGHEWPPTDGSRPKFGGLPIYTVDEQKFIAVL